MFPMHGQETEFIAEKDEERKRKEAEKVCFFDHILQILRETAVSCSKAMTLLTPEHLPPQMAKEEAKHAGKPQVTPRQSNSGPPHKKAVGATAGAAMSRRVATAPVSSRVETAGHKGESGKDQRHPPSLPSDVSPAPQVYSDYPHLVMPIGMLDFTPALRRLPYHRRGFSGPWT